MGVYENVKTMTLGVNGLRDIPLCIRKKVEFMVIDSFKNYPEEIPVSYDYSPGVFFHEGKRYRHKVVVTFLYHTEDNFEYDCINILVNN
jgi:hypothetical protein